MANEQKPPRALDDLLGRRVRMDGHEWSVRYSEAQRRVVLERPLEMELFLGALRDGAVKLGTDADAIAAQGPPTTRDAALREWLFLDALIAGGRLHGTLTEPELAALEQRIGVLTAYLSLEIRRS
jgi:hypothetical protein